MENTRIQNKIKLLFDKISTPGYTIDSYYADTFINKLSNNSDLETVYITTMPLLPDLLADSLENIKHYHNTVKVFVVRTLAIVSRTESHFAMVLSKQGNKLLELLNEIDAPKVNPSLKVACMEMALALVTHSSGVNWILETEIWKKVLNAKNSTTVFIYRLMYQFASDFMWKLNDLGDEATMNSVIAFLWSPIQELDLLNVVSYTVNIETQEETCNILEPCIYMLLSIVSKRGCYYKQGLLYKVIYQNHGLVTKLYVLLDKIRKDETLLLIKKLLFYLVLLRVFQTKPFGPDVEYVMDDFMDVKVLFFNTLQNILQKRKVTMMLDYCYMCNQIWATVRQDMQLNLCKNNKLPLELHNQILVLCLVPVLVYIHLYKGKVEGVGNERINEYVFLLLNKACEHTARTAYLLRDIIMELGILSEVITQSVKRLTSLKGHLNDDLANIVFQGLFFVLRSYAPNPVDSSNQDGNSSIAGSEDLEEYEKKVVVMTYVIETVNSIVKSYNINWHDSLEVICLNTLIHNILTKRSNLSCKFVVASLNLMTVVVQKFLPPNLSLLMESKPGTAMHEIGSLILTKLHDMHWETRDSALELLHVCTEIAYVKFPPIQKQLLDNNLINVALTIAYHDFEPYVQVSALKCVGAAVKVRSLWDQLKMEHPNLLDELVMLLRNNQEGIVRKEVCSVLCEIYQNEKLTPTFKQSLYDHMASTVMSDFHWEVQLVSLSFWKIVIQSFLTDQGMLDGKFPPVTFSGVSRKIVTLNQTEIQKRLLIVLNELASVGCLTILLKLVHDDNEVSVMDAALSVSQELFAILQEYKIPEIIKPQEGDPKTVDELLCDIKDDAFDNCENVHEMDAENSNKADNVIESILNEGDINLLADLYKKHMHLQNDVPATVRAPRIKLLRNASPYLYVSFMSTNKCKAAINEKREWKDGIRSVSSLLDDVLGIYDCNDEVNSLDCY